MVPHIHRDLIIAWADGALIDCFYDGEWHFSKNPTWSSALQYRIHQEVEEGCAV